MLSDTFIERLTEQVGNELAAHLQYLAIAIWYDGETLPALAEIFYLQAKEEHNHAMMLVQYLMDQDQQVVMPAIPAPQSEFADLVEPVTLALVQERRVTEQFNSLAAITRDSNDYQSSHFVDWFLKEQVEEVAKMTDLLRTVERGRDTPLELERFLAGQAAPAGPDPTRPAPAGGGV